NSDPDEIEKTLKTGKQVRSSLARTGISADVTLDIVMETLTPKGEGDDTNGYREKLQILGGKTLTLFIVKEDGKYKILDSMEKPSAIGLEVLDRVVAQNLKSASLLHDWLRDEQHLGGGAGPLSGEAFPRVWPKRKEADASQL